jgi:hypothetical protein
MPGHAGLCSLEGSLGIAAIEQHPTDIKKSCIAAVCSGLVADSCPAHRSAAQNNQSTLFVAFLSRLSN